MMVAEKHCSDSAGSHIIQGGRCGHFFSRKVEKYVIWQVHSASLVHWAAGIMRYLGAATRLQPHHIFLPEVNFGVVQADQHSSLCNKIQFSTNDYEPLPFWTQKVQIMKQRDSIWECAGSTEAVDLTASFRGNLCIRVGLFSWKPRGKNVVSSWYSAGHCCFQHGETAWAGRAVPACAGKCPSREKPPKPRICVVWTWGFVAPSELQGSESPGGAACQRLLPMGEGSVILEMSGQGKGGWK